MKLSEGPYGFTILAALQGGYYIMSEGETHSFRQVLFAGTLKECLLYIDACIAKHYVETNNAH